MTEPSPSRAVRVVAAYQHLLMIVSRLGATDRVVWDGPDQCRADRLALDEVREAYQRVCDHPRFGPTPAPLVEYTTREGHLVLMCLGNVLVDPPDPRAACASIAQAQVEHEAKLREQREREARELEEAQRKLWEEDSERRLAHEKYLADREAGTIMAFGCEGGLVTVFRLPTDGGGWRYYAESVDTMAGEVDDPNYQGCSMSKPAESLERALRSLGPDDFWLEFRPWKVNPGFRAAVWDLARAAAGRRAEDRPARLDRWQQVCQPEE